MFHSLIEGEEVKNEEINNDALGYIVRKWGAAVKNILKCEIGFELGDRGWNNFEGCVCVCVCVC